MKAAAYTRYGPPDVVQIMDVEKPVPKDNEVLIKVRAAFVNPADWRLMGGGSNSVTSASPVTRAEMRTQFRSRA